MPRPSYQPTEEQQRVARAMAAVGARQEDIAAELGMTPKTLRKHFGPEMRRGRTQANVKVGQTLFVMATSGRHLGASIYWDRTRGFARKSAGETACAPMLPPQIIIRTEGPETPSGEGGADQ